MKMLKYLFLILPFLFANASSADVKSDCETQSMLSYFNKYQNFLNYDLNERSQFRPLSEHKTTSRMFFCSSDLPTNTKILSFCKKRFFISMSNVSVFFKQIESWANLTLPEPTEDQLDQIRTASHLLLQITIESSSNQKECNH